MGYSGWAPASAVRRQVCVEPDLFEAYGLVLWADLSACPISSPTSSGEKPLECLAICVHPARGAVKAICPQRVGARIQQPRTVASMLGCRIHNELIDRAVDTGVGIVILAGHGAGESHDSRAVGRGKNPEGCLRRAFNGRTPRVGHLRQ